ncbi:hypothetical protein GGI07_002936 [Coemansia sp. Benny D115]|nr:hypothetical protein GGI07_002936 [Coemansia sp. Benny D115]
MTDPNKQLPKKRTFAIPTVEDIERTRPPTNHSIVKVSELQRGNPLLACIRNVRWTFAPDIQADILVNRTTSLLYLSIKYHHLHPEYIQRRISALDNNFRLRVLLVLVDTDDSKLALREINRTALLGNMTLLLAWSLDEAGRYVELLKSLENSQAGMIREKVEDNYLSALTSVRAVNRTDVVTLKSNFGSFANLSRATQDELSMCPGLGDVKAKRLFKAFNEPFVNKK